MSKVIKFSDISDAVKELCLQAAFKLPDDTLKALQESLTIEKSPAGRSILNQCLQNASLASSESLPLCQDTGFAIFFVNMGSEVSVDGGILTDAINDGVRRGYKEGYLRNSIVKDPLFNRINTGDNTPALIHIDIVKGDMLSITLLPKGGGSENMSSLAMLKPSDGREGIIDFIVSTVVKAGGNPCPPVVVGAGIGGTADKAALLAKKALLRQIGSSHADPQYAGLEKDILARINDSGVGPQGLGGTVSALAVHIETFPCHIASMPVAVNLNCHSARKATVNL
ncbi:MAG: fumarate hydratase [Fibrobacter sp.]|nr:fumarate hydratase [Fibrobacter sp.]